MRITTSNVLLGVTPSVTTGASSDLPSNVTDQDFSVFYTSSSQTNVVFEFGNVANINYVAVAGVNIEGNKNDTSRVRVFDGSNLIRTINVSSNRPVVINFTETISFSNMKVVLYNPAGDKNISVNYIAAGLTFEVPNGGEQSGYDRQYLKRNYGNVSTVNKQTAPVALLRKKLQSTGTLSIPNALVSFCEQELDDFFIFAQDNHFFISERDDVFSNAASGINPTSYMCFDISKQKTSAHSQTRELNNNMFTFKVFNGI